ncbi:MAG: putative toxin-antitoxin system toxin component, PIN family [Ignavibacteriales bacterium]|nr:putative toxin-antitoxin system toxin component, PIN family [Ignavibacteriales bacterium]
MIKVVPDANVLVSGMLGTPGPTRKIINLALAKKIIIFGSSATYQEFCEKIQMARLQKYLKRQIFSPEKIILDYRAFVNMLEPVLSDQLKRFVERDPDDDEYVKVARACGSKIIITRDKDLLDIKKFEKVLAVTPEKFIQSYAKLSLQS